MDVVPGSTRSNGNGVQVGSGGKTGSGRTGDPDKVAKGRKDHGTEVEPNTEELMKGMKKLDKLRGEKMAAAKAYNDARKALAKRSGFMADVVEATVRAYAGEKEDFEVQHRRAEQLSLAFEAVHREQFAS